MAGLTVQNLFDSKSYLVFEVILFSVSALVLVLGVFNYFTNDRLIRTSEMHIGDYQTEYL
jgi:putative membrane protein